MDKRRHGQELARGSLDELQALLTKMDGSGYGRYRTILGVWEGPGFDVEIVKVQADPYAPPSRLEVRLPERVAGFPSDLHNMAVRRRALADFLLRGLQNRTRKTALKVDAAGQEVLDRSAMRVDDGAVTARLGIGLPAHGRRIDGRAAREALCVQLPRAVRNSLLFDAVDQDALRRFADTVEDADTLRRLLPSLGLVAFVADGSMPARRSGVDDRPLTGGVPFHSPESLRVEVDLPHRGTVTGMGVPRGVSLIVGGGFHGKSTLLRTLERGVYDHVPGDGRELAVTDASAVKVRAEDGRGIARVDISAFVGRLPGGADTAMFSTENASGSTSQAATTVEALEAGSTTLLLDEDTTATNIMIRDERMRQLVADEHEPLTPLVDVVRSLYEDHGVSVVLAMGGSGKYIDVADHVVMMDAYRPRDITARAAGLRDPEARALPFPGFAHRVCDPASVDPTARGRRRIKHRGTDTLVFGEDDIGLGAVEQLVAGAQLTGIGLALSHARRTGLFDGSRTIAEVLDALDEEFRHRGAEAVHGGFLGDFAVPRRFEIAAALSRLRTLRVLDSRKTPRPGAS